MRLGDSSTSTLQVLLADEQHQLPHLFLGLHLLFPGWVNGIDHPLDGEVGDRTKDGETEQQADDFIPPNRAGDVFYWNLSQHHHQKAKYSLNTVESNRKEP